MTVRVNGKGRKARLWIFIGLGGHDLPPTSSGGLEGAQQGPWLLQGPSVFPAHQAEEPSLGRSRVQGVSREECHARFKKNQLNECVKAIIQNMKRCCICFSSSGAVILKLVGHAVTCVVVCQHFKDDNKKENHSIL